MPRRKLADTLTPRGITISGAHSLQFAKEEGQRLDGQGGADRLYGGGGGDQLFGNGGRDFLEGGPGADYLSGGAGNDTLAGGLGIDILDDGADTDSLDGGAGADTLQGGPGADYLAGEGGEDSYRYASGGGVDTLLDGDGLGTIQYDGITLTGGTKALGALWRSADDRFTYSLRTEANSSQTLAISGPGNGTLFMKDFEDGKLGIRLSDTPAAPPAPPSTTRAIRGDLAYRWFFQPADLNAPPAGYRYDPIPQNPGYYFLIDDIGNIVRHPNAPWSGGWQVIGGSEGADAITVGDAGGNLNGFGGDDAIYGGAVVGRISGRAGNGAPFDATAIETLLRKVE